MAPSQRTPELKEPAVLSLLGSFDAEVRGAGSYAITVEGVCERLQISPEDAYRALYRSAPVFGGYVPERFTPDEINELAGFVAQFANFDVRRLFRSAGATLSGEDLAELSALYYDLVHHAVAAHRLQTDEYRQMCSRFKARRRAFEVYLDHFFDKTELLEQTISCFMATHRCTFPELGRLTVRRHLKLLVERHIISFDMICEELYRRLAEGTEQGAPAFSAALKTLGLNRLPADRQDLRAHYKTLMKTYHPDVNPAGLEMSKKINAAYAELLAAWS